MMKPKTILSIFVFFVLTVQVESTYAQEDEFSLDDPSSPSDVGTSSSAPPPPAEATTPPPAEPTLTETSPAANTPAETITPAENTPATTTTPEPTTTPSEATTSTTPTQESVPVPEEQKTAQPSPAEPPPPEVVPPPPTPPPTPKVTVDEPDYMREEKFHSIYKKYNETPTNVEAWEKATSDRKTENYTIQRGDTLWDLSKTLFGDSFYWPKVWSLNKATITNPHEINPSLTLQFYPGTASQPPTLGLTEKKDLVAKVETPEKVTDETPPSSQPQARTRVPVVKEIPPSLPAYVVKGVEKPILEVEKKPSLPLSPLVPLSCFIEDQAIAGVGEIKETELGMATAFEFQYVYVRLNDPNQKIYTVIKEKEPIVLQVRNDVDEKDLPKAKFYEVQGEIEVIEPVTESGDLYRAIVRKNLVPIEVGTFLISGQLPYVNVAPTALVSSVQAEIVGGQYGAKSKIYDSNTFVFLNQGSAGGIQVGASLPIFAVFKTRNEISSANRNEKRVGQLKIVRTSEHSSTGYITLVTDDVRQGDLVGINSAGVALPSTGDSQPSSPNPAPEDELNLE